MPVKVKTLGSKLLWIQASGKFSKKDYQHFVPEIEHLISKLGKIRILFEMRDFHGWDAGALWEDIKFDLKHFSDIERLAMVGDKKWEEWMAKFCKPFTTATIRYFDLAHTEDAQAWIEAG
jgi:SpoIIAA-like